MVEFEYSDDIILKAIKNSNGEELEDGNLLDLFSIYVSSNKNYKYTHTYLKRKISSFKSQLSDCQVLKSNLYQLQNNFYRNASTTLLEKLNRWIIIVANAIIVNKKEIYTFDSYIREHEKLTFKDRRRLTRLYKPLIFSNSLKIGRYIGFFCITSNKSRVFEFDADKVTIDEFANNIRNKIKNNEL